MLDGTRASSGILIAGQLKKNPKGPRTEIIGF